MPQREKRERNTHTMINAETSRRNMNVFVIRFFATLSFAHTKRHNNNAADTCVNFHCAKKNYEFHFAE